MTTIEIATEIKRQVCLNPVLPMSWGASKWGFAKDDNENPYLQFKVRGLKFKGIVKVTLEPSDTYTVKFIKVKKTEVTIKHTIENVYCDELADVIDNYVEYTGTPESYKAELIRKKQPLLFT